MRTACCLFLLLAAAQLAAQNRADPAVAFPATTLAYASLRVEALGDFDSMGQVARALGAGAAVNPAGILAEQLGLKLDAAQVQALNAGVLRVSAAVLDITLKGPKLQFVVEHKDLSALQAALRAADADSPAIESFEDYEGVRVYQVRLIAAARTASSPFGSVTPMDGWLVDQRAFSLAILEDRALVLAPTMAAAKDAIDGLQFPDDPLDTLLGNRRYTEALAQFKDPAASLFVNIQSVINTAERIGGDSSGESLLGMMIRQMIPDSGLDAALAASLTQYEQLKGFSAALWLPPGEVQARLEMRLSFHNAPGWLTALRTDPRPMPLTGMIPDDAAFALTANVQDGEELYGKLKDFFTSRAREAGKPEALKSLRVFEPEFEAELKELWKHVSGGQAVVVIPTSQDTSTFYSFRLRPVLLFELRDLGAAEEDLYARLVSSRLFKWVRPAECELSPVQVIEGIEVHSSQSGDDGFAFIPGNGAPGVFATGDARALAHLIRMRAQGRTLASHPAVTAARASLWETQNLGVYLNAGTALDSVADVVGVVSTMFSGEQEDDEVDRDDAEKERNPVPRLASFFSGAAIVGASRSTETSIDLRFSIAGVPGTKAFQELAAHYAAVERNFEVRDDLLRVRDAACTHLVLKPAPAPDVEALLEAGYLRERAWALDPFGAPEEVTYALSPVPSDVDIRQAILLAYQRRPALQDRHLAVLWNGHVVSLAPDQLQAALERAQNGLALDETMYAVPLKPLYERPPRGLSARTIEEMRAEPRKIDVVVIDDEGNESTIEVTDKDAVSELEKALDEAPAKESRPAETPKSPPEDAPRPEGE